MTTETIDAIDCGTAVELCAAIERMGISLDLSLTTRVSLIEETLSDGSTIQMIHIYQPSQ